MASPAQLQESVTQHLRRDFSVVRYDATVGQALAEIRAQPPTGRIVYFYALDADGRLKGVVPTRRLLLNPLDTPVADIMVRPVIALPSSATLLDACEFFILHRLLAFPVIDEAGKMIGIVDVETYTDELAGLESAQRNDDLFQLIGVHLSEAQQKSPWSAFRHRFPWLLCNIGGGILAAFLSGAFEAELQHSVALALFIPVVLALAESVTIQSVSLALESLQGKTPTWKSLLTRARTEVMTGAFLGIGSAALVAFVAFLWIGQWPVVACLLAGIGGGVVFAAAVGWMLPNLFRLLEWNPQVAAGPICLALADMATLLIYFNVARWMIGG